MRPLCSWSFFLLSIELAGLFLLRTIKLPHSPQPHPSGGCTTANLSFSIQSLSFPWKNKSCSSQKKIRRGYEQNIPFQNALEPSKEVALRLELGPHLSILLGDLPAPQPGPLGLEYWPRARPPRGAQRQRRRGGTSEKSDSNAKTVIFPEGVTE